MMAQRRGAIDENVGEIGHRSDQKQAVTEEHHHAGDHEDAAAHGHHPADHPLDQGEKGETEQVFHREAGDAQAEQMIDVHRLAGGGGLRRPVARRGDEPHRPGVRSANLIGGSYPPAGGTAERRPARRQGCLDHPGRGGGGWWGGGGDWRRGRHLEVEHIPEVGDDDIGRHHIAADRAVGIANRKRDAGHGTVAIDHRSAVLFPGIDGIGQAQMGDGETLDRQLHRPGVDAALAHHQLAPAAETEGIDRAAEPGCGIGQREIKEAAGRLYLEQRQIMGRRLLDQLGTEALKPGFGPDLNGDLGQALNGMQGGQHIAVGADDRPRGHHPAIDLAAVHRHHRRCHRVRQADRARQRHVPAHELADRQGVVVAEAVVALIGRQDDDAPDQGDPHQGGHRDPHHPPRPRAEQDGVVRLPFHRVLHDFTIRSVPPAARLASRQRVLKSRFFSISLSQISASTLSDPTWRSRATIRPRTRSQISWA